MRGLGRREPTDWRHVERFPLTAGTVTKPTPCVLGINWYQRFDDPQQDSAGRWWLAKPGDNLGQIRGGHAICVKPGPIRDLDTWWGFYDQGMTGECVGFSCSRMMSLLNRVRYRAPWLYMRATETDEWPGEDDPMSGTSVRAACEILRIEGHERVTRDAPDQMDGIVTYRWATSVDDVHAVIASPAADRLGAVPLVNSWGRYFPHYTWLPDTVLERLLGEGGECAVPTDR